MGLRAVWGDSSPQSPSWLQVVTVSMNALQKAAFRWCVCGGDMGIMKDKSTCLKWRGERTGPFCSGCQGASDCGCIASVPISSQHVEEAGLVWEREHHITHIQRWLGGELLAPEGLFWKAPWLFCSSSGNTVPWTASVTQVSSGIRIPSPKHLWSLDWTATSCSPAPPPQLGPVSRSPRIGRGPCLVLCLCRPSVAFWCPGDWCEERGGDSWFSSAGCLQSFRARKVVKVAFQSWVLSCCYRCSLGIPS